MYVLRVFVLSIVSCVRAMTTRRVRTLINTIDTTCVYTQKSIVLFDCEHIIPRSFIRDKRIENDMHLVYKCTPSLNRSRGNKKFDEFTTPNTYGITNTVTKGIVSRTCLYFMYTYHTQYTRSDFYERVIDRFLLEEWYDMYGCRVREEDVLRNRFVLQHQGVLNVFVENNNVSV